MSIDIYAPPKADITVDDNKPGSVVKAVVVGSVIEIVGTLLVGLLVGIVYGAVLASQGLSAEDMQHAMEQLDPWSMYGLAASFFGLLVSVLAGYVCARIANTATYKAVYILSGISVALGTVFGVGTYAWWTLILLGLVTVSAILLGARLYIRRL